MTETTVLMDIHNTKPLPLKLLQQTKQVLFCSKINTLLVFIPLGIISYFLKFSDVYTFIFNFLAIIPLAKLLGMFTEEIATFLGETFGALLNATLGNAVELIVSVLALKNGLIKIVQASLLGSILSNLLLVLGLSFFMGGIKFKEQQFNTTAAQTSSSLLSLALLSLLVPAAFQANLNKTNLEQNIMNLSHGTAIVLLLAYIAFLLFQLRTHTFLYNETSEETEKSEYSLWFLIFMLIVVTVVVGICAEFLVDSIDGVTKKVGLSEAFVGIILIPIVGNAAEHLTAVSVAMKNKMELSIGVALGSSIQIALFVTPLLVVIGWILNQPMSLFFDIFQTSMLFISVLIVNYLIQDGKSNWLEGFMLLCSYVIIAIAFFYYPNSE